MSTLAYWHPSPRPSLRTLRTPHTLHNGIGPQTALRELLLAPSFVNKPSNTQDHQAHKAVTARPCLARSPGDPQAPISTRLSLLSHDPLSLHPASYCPLHQLDRTPSTPHFRFTRPYAFPRDEPLGLGPRLAKCVWLRIFFACFLPPPFLLPSSSPLPLLTPVLVSRPKM